MSISLVLMISGQSKRMGAIDKRFLLFGGKPLYQKAIDLITKFPLEPIVVSDHTKILSYGRKKGCIAIRNRKPEEGQSTSIGLGVSAAKPTNGLMFLTCDQVFLSPKTIQQMVETYEKNPILTIPYYGGKRGGPMVFPPSYRQQLQRLQGDGGGKKLTMDKTFQRVEIPRPIESIDIDTLEEYRRWKPWQHRSS
ncbi:MAG: nucleotidyltransferase family protein [Tissierellia bacterium]|nr:nucleotidyltransferase family protein [Tissierellia bacterium]